MTWRIGRHQAAYFPIAAGDRVFVLHQFRQFGQALLFLQQAMMGDALVKQQCGGRDDLVGLQMAELFERLVI